MTSVQTHNFRWELHGDVLLVNVLPGEIESECWDAYLGMLRNDKVRLVLTLVVGAVSIDANKRRGAADALKERGLDVIVMTDSRLTRGMLTAMSWLGAKFKAFPWSDLDKALEETGAPSDIQDKLRSASRSFEQSAASLANTN